MRKRTKKSVKASCDKLWSQIIRSKGACEVCGTTQNLEAHHIIGRRLIPTRWDLQNGLCLCSKHHKFDLHFSAHGGGEVQFYKWLDEYLGEDVLNALNEKSKNKRVYYLQDYLEIEAKLKEILAQKA